MNLINKYNNISEEVNKQGIKSYLEVFFTRRANELVEFLEIGSKYAPNLARNENAKAERHPYHIVKPSPKPILASFILFLVIAHFLQFFHNFWNIPENISSVAWFFSVGLGYVALIAVLYIWFWYMHFESTYLGKYTRQVKRGLRIGIKLFIVSEVMFFVGAFWAYLHGALNPSSLMSGVWPPVGIELGSWTLIPFLETVTLVSSGMALTNGYNLFLRGSRWGLIFGLFYTIIFAVFFVLLQYIELTRLLQFTIADSFFGSSFYFAVGCHALHVILGTIALIIALVRHWFNHFYIDSHIGLLATIWYWHFVDIVWLFLFLVFYVWGS